MQKRKAAGKRAVHSRAVDGARGLGVTSEARSALATSIAFFKAERFREATPETLRRSDIAAGGHVIADVLEHCANGEDFRRQKKGWRPQAEETMRTLVERA